LSRLCTLSAAEFRRVYAKTDLTCRDVAKHFGIAHDTAVRKAKAMGLPPKPSGYPSRIDRALLSHLWAAGVQMEGIGQACGVTRTAVHYAAKRFGLPSRTTTVISLREYLDVLLVRAMARDAAIEQRQMILAEMADVNATGHRVGAAMARAG